MRLVLYSYLILCLALFFWLLFDLPFALHGVVDTILLPSALVVFIVVGWYVAPQTAAFCRQCITTRR